MHTYLRDTCSCLCVFTYTHTGAYVPTCTHTYMVSAYVIKICTQIILCLHPNLKLSYQFGHKL